jgi:hypothetical protein
MPIFTNDTNKTRTVHLELGINANYTVDAHLGPGDRVVYGSEWAQVSSPTTSVKRSPMDIAAIHVIEAKKTS